MCSLLLVILKAKLKGKTKKIKNSIKIQKDEDFYLGQKFKFDCFLGPLQPVNSDSALNSRPLEPRTETDNSGTPHNNGGMRLHDFVSKTVNLGWLHFF